MLSDNQSGIIWSLACMAILALCGVFLATLVGKKHGSSKARNELMRDFQTGNHEVENLRSEIQALTTKHQMITERATRNAATHEAKQKAAIHLNQSIQELQAKKKELQLSLVQIRGEFDAYRIKARSEARRNAVGEKLDFLTLKSGRQFQRVTITRVTPLGLEISHADGLARIEMNDLGREFTERFDWNEQEREALTQAEQANKPVDEAKKPEQENSPNTPTVDPALGNLEKYRTDVSLLKSKSLTLRSAIRTAESNSRYANNRSVPGSLRTWDEQAALLKSQLVRIDAQLALARELLRKENPSDPLLRPDPN
jgi:hypothetical protein